jgi:hypothetical protein
MKGFSAPTLNYKCAGTGNTLIGPITIDIDPPSNGIEEDEHYFSKCLEYCYSYSGAVSSTTFYCCQLNDMVCSLTDDYAIVEDTTATFVAS